MEAVNMNRIDLIRPADKASGCAAKAQWDSIGKPLGSLGLLEEAIIKIASIQGTPDVCIDHRTVVVLCADNGVVQEGVTQTDSSVTATCADAIANGTSSVNQLAKTFHANVVAVDIGIDGEVNNPKLLQKKVAFGTKNLAVEAAMSTEECKQAITIGMDLVRDLQQQGTNLLVTGEMGIGNTTTSAALTSVLLNLPPKEVTGRGAGLDSAGLARKIQVIERAIALHHPDSNHPFELLAKLGGLDIAGMVGLFLGGAVYHVPIVMDGVISTVAAAIAFKIHPETKDYWLPSHVSEEPAAHLLLEQLQLSPIIHGQLHLGEGTGGVLLLPLLDGALSVYRHAHRFEEIAVERYVELK